MKEKEAILIEKKLISRGIESVFKWITGQEKHLSTRGAQFIPKSRTAYSQAEQWFFDAGKRITAEEAKRAMKGLPKFCDTCEGAQAAICYLEGLAQRLQLEADVCDLKLQAVGGASRSGDRPGTLAQGSFLETAASKTARAEELAGSDGARRPKQ